MSFYIRLSGLKAFFEVFLTTLSAQWEILYDILNLIIQANVGIENLRMEEWLSQPLYSTSDSPAENTDTL